MEQLFNEVVGLDAQTRERRLAAACQGDDRLRRLVESLVLADARQAQQLVGALDEAPTDLSPGAPAVQFQRIGNYRLLRAVGSGGMGDVYEAEQESPRRVVALKLLRFGAGSPQALARRFRREGQVLGQLHHPAIAHVYEAGAADGARADGSLARSIPFIAMELVRGVPLDVFAADRVLGVRERLTLVARVCDGVEHAHTRGVVHRDLKPQNILVDGGGQPKILDFGIARLVGADVPATTIQTETGQLLGTLAYMSPEQLGGDPSRVTSATDVYAIGVILYELLGGRLPHDIRNRSLPEAIRILQDEEAEPLVLSKSLTTCDSRRPFSGDLPTIVGKALERDASRRYASAADLAADIRRHLADEPIAARPASRFYRLRKFVRRHRALVVAAAAVVMALVVGLIGTTMFAWRAELRRQDAEASQQVAEQSGYHAAIFAAEKALEAGEVVLARSMLEQCSADLRGWEWRYIAARADVSMYSATLPLRPVTHASLAPDGTSLFLTSSDDVVHVWDMRNGRFVGDGIRIRGPGPPIATCVSADGRWLAVAAADGGVEIWELPVLRFHWRNGELVGKRLTFSADGRILAARARSGESIAIIDVESGVVDRFPPLAGGEIQSVMVTPDGAVIVAEVTSHRRGSPVAETVLIDRYTQREVSRFPGRPLTLSQDSRMVCVVDGELAQIAMTNVRPEATNRVGEADAWITGAEVAGLCLLSDHLAVLAEAGGAVIMWDYILGRWDFRGERGTIVLENFGTPCALAASATGEVLVAVSVQGELRAWNKWAIDPDHRYGWTTNSQTIAADIASDGSVTVTSGVVFLTCWDSKRQVPRWRRPVSATILCVVAIDPRSRSVAAGDDDGIVHLLGLDSADIVGRSLPLGAPIRALEWSSGCADLFAGTDDGRVYVVATGGADPALTAQLVFETPSGVTVIDVAASPDGSHLAVVGGDGQLELLRLETATRCWRLSTGELGSVSKTCFSGDGRTLIAGMADGAIAYLRTSDGMLIRRASGSGAAVTSMHLVEHAEMNLLTRLIVGDDDGSVRIRDSVGSELLAWRPTSTPAIIATRLVDGGATLLLSSHAAPVLRFETEPPRDVDTWRIRVIENSARMLWWQHPLWFDSNALIAAIEADAALPAEVQKIVCEMAAKHGDDPFGLDRAAWSVVRRGDSSSEQRQRALHMSTRAVRLCPWSVPMRLTLAMAHLRVGNANEARAELLECRNAMRRSIAASERLPPRLHPALRKNVLEKLQLLCGPSAPSLVVEGVTAMVLWHCGDGQGARDALARAEAVNQAEKGVDREAAQLLDEVRAMMR